MVIGGFWALHTRSIWHPVYHVQGFPWLSVASQLLSRVKPFCLEAESFSVTGQFVSSLSRQLRTKFTVSVLSQATVTRDS